MSKTSKKDFAALYKELEEIVEWFENDVDDIDEALKKYERGAQLAVELKKHLETAENKVTKISQSFEQE